MIEHRLVELVKLMSISYGYSYDIKEIWSEDKSLVRALEVTFRKGLYAVNKVFDLEEIRFFTFGVDEFFKLHTLDIFEGFRNDRRNEI